MLEEAVAGEVFAAGHGEAGNDFPVLLSTARAERGRRRLPDLRPQDLRIAQPGLDPARNPRHGHDRPGQPQDRPRLPAARHRRLPHRRDLGHPRHAGDAQRRHHHRGRVHPRPVRRPSGAGRAGRGRCRSCSGSSPGPSRPSPACTSGWPSGPWSWPWPEPRRRPRIALGGRAMAYHPMIQHSIAEMAIELESITAHVERIAVRLVASGRLRHGLARQAGRRQVQGGRRRQANRRPGHGRLGWHRECSSPTSSSASTATCAAAASTRPTAALVHELVGKSALGHPRRRTSLVKRRPAPRSPGSTGTRAGQPSDTILVSSTVYSWFRYQNRWRAVGVTPNSGRGTSAGGPMATLRRRPAPVTAGHRPPAAGPSRRPSDSCLAGAGRAPGLPGCRAVRFPEALANGLEDHDRGGRSPRGAAAARIRRHPH